MLVNKVLFMALMRIKQPFLSQVPGAQIDNKINPNIIPLIMAKNDSSALIHQDVNVL